MRQVIGFEGGRLDQVNVVTWGAAALEIDGQLVNPWTGTRSPLDRFDKLVTEGYVTRLPVAIPFEHPEPDCSVVCMFRENELGRLLSGRVSERDLLHGMWPEGLLGDAVTAEFYTMAFVTKAWFERFVAQRTDKIYQVALRRKSSLELRDETRALIDGGLILNLRDPNLNAMRVLYTEPDHVPFQERLARCVIHDEGDWIQFKGVLAELRQ